MCIMEKNYRLLQDIEYSSLCYTVGPCWLSVLYIVVCAAAQAPPSMGFSRQVYWSGLPFPSPIFTLLYIKQITNKDLPYSTGNLSQYSVIIYKEKQSEKKICVFRNNLKKNIHTQTHPCITYN